MHNHNRKSEDSDILLFIGIIALMIKALPLVGVAMLICAKKDDVKAMGFILAVAGIIINGIINMN